MSYRDVSDEEIITSWINNLSQERDLVTSDSDLSASDNLSLKEHNHSYTRLLELYVDNYESSSKEKRFIRKVLCWVSIGILVFVTVMVIILSSIAIVKCVNNVNFIKSVIPPLLASFGALVGAYVAIPKIIANYLFDKDEEKHLSTIIGKIQEYDSKIRDKR